MLVLLDNSFFTFINIYTLLSGLAAELATVEVEPAFRAVAQCYNSMFSKYLAVSDCSARLPAGGGRTVLFLAYHSWKREWLMFLIHGFIVGEPLDGVLLDAQCLRSGFYHLA